MHTHPFGGVRDDTRSALLGGTTSALAFVDALEGERPVEAARRTLADEVPDSLIDLAFHTVIWEPLAYRTGRHARRGRARRRQRQALARPTSSSGSWPTTTSRWP